MKIPFPAIYFFIRRHVPYGNRRRPRISAFANKCFYVIFGRDEEREAEWVVVVVVVYDGLIT